MVTNRVTWDSISSNIRHAIEANTGPLTRVEPVSDGLNSELALVLHASSEVTFAKGLRVDHPRVWTQTREKLINPHVRSTTATLKWSIETEDWNILGFEHIAGRTADYAPDSPDLVKFVDTMRRLQAIPCPDTDLKLAEKRWASYSDTPELFAGNQLLHTEWSPTNVLIQDDDALFVDWAWATRGAAWIDPACWVVWLVASGHSPEQAEDWAAKIDSWADAPAAALTAFAAAQAGLWGSIADADPELWIKRMAEAAAAWKAHRRARD